MADTPAAAATAIEETDDVVVIRILCGDLDENHIKAVRTEISAACESRKQPFVLDLSKVKFVPSLSLGMLVRIANEFRARGQRVILANLQPTVRQVLSITRLDRLFEIHETVDAAVREISIK